MKLTAFIPARGNSQSIPRKNLQKCGENTLLENAIACAQNATSVGEVVVSSDSEEILAIATATSCTALKRPSSLATNESPMEDAVLHFLKNITCQWFVILQPTSPLRKPADIDEAFRLLTAKKADGVIAVSEPASHPLKAMLLDTNERLTAITDPSYPFTNRQQLPKAVTPNGAIYIYNAEMFAKHRCFYLANVVAFSMAQALDIDTLDDLNKARKAMQKGDAK